MQRLIRGRYLRLVLPVLAGLLVLALLVLLFSGFGFRYLLKKPVPLESLHADELPGSYVTLDVRNVEDSFAFYGYQDENGDPVVSERFCLFTVDGKYLIIRVTKDFVPELDKLDNANDMIASGEIGSILELQLGSLKGTLNKTGKDAEATLRSWIASHQIDAQLLTDQYMNADISAYEGAADGDYTAYLDAAILPVQLDCGYLGTHRAGVVKVLTLISLLILVLAVLLIVSVFLGMWEKAYRAALRQHGRKPLAMDFDAAALFGPGLRIGERFVFVSGSLFSKILPIKDVIWAYPRSKRLEGGRLRWSLVLKTTDGQEASVRLDSESTVEQAIGCLASRGWPLTVGFDKEKQRLYKKDLAAFQGRVRNGSF